MSYKPTALFVPFSLRSYDPSQRLPARSIVVDSIVAAANRYFQMQDKPHCVVINSEELLDFIAENDLRCQWLEAIFSNTLGENFTVRYCARYRGCLYPLGREFAKEINNFCKAVPGFTLSSAVGDPVPEDNLDLVAFEIFPQTS